MTPSGLQAQAQALVLALSLSACGSSLSVKNAETFSRALDTTTVAADAGLRRLADMDVADQDVRAADAFVFDGGALNLALDRSLLDEIEKRRAILRALHRYADALAAVVSIKDRDTLDAALAHAGDDIGAVAADFDGGGDDLAQTASDAFRFIAVRLIAHDLDKKLAPIVRGAHGDLQRVVVQYKTDLRNDAGGGFIALLDGAIAGQVAHRRKMLMVLRKDRRTDREALYDAVIKARQDVRALERTRDAFDALPPALDSLLAAHAALAEPASSDAAATAALFAEDARQLAAIFEDLRQDRNETP
ncbi:MAG: hypothetical protein AAFV51_12895 [Pseudomonadota bacterium]